MKVIKILVLISWAYLTALSVQAQKKVLQSFQYKAEANEKGQFKELTQLSYIGTSSIRLYFEQVQLGSNSYLLLEGKDGAQQKLDTEALKNWRNSSAYFNGQNVKLSLYQAKGESVSLKLKELMVNKQGRRVDNSIVTPQDRTESTSHLPPWATAVGRFTDGVTAKGTGWIAANGAIVTDLGFGAQDDDGSLAGTFLNQYDIIEFNVPPSNPDGTVNHSLPEDQFPLDKASHLWRRIEGNKIYNGIGYIRVTPYEGTFGEYVAGGYTIIEALPNGDGQRPGERISQYFQVIRHGDGLAMDNLDMEIFHYSSSGSEVSNQTLKRKTVALKNPHFWLTRVSDKSRFLVYDTPDLYFGEEDMEGAPIVYPGTNVAVGIHSEGHDQFEAPSFGTGFRDQLFRKHLGEFFSTNTTYVDQATLAGIGNGNIYQPYSTVLEGVQQARDDAIINITHGSYNESITIDKPLTLSAPVGTVTIGAEGGANFRIKQAAIPLSWSYENISELSFENDGLVEQSSIKGFPNPFTDRTELHYTLAEDSPVQVKVYDMMGQEVYTLVQEEQFSGKHSVQWDGRNYQGQAMPAGLYIMQLKAGPETSALRLMKQ